MTNDIVDDDVRPDGWTKAAEWNLIAGGPSRQHLRPEHLLGNGAPVVTVNRAIDIIDRGFHVDFAAFADGPGGVWTPMKLERYIAKCPYLQIWATVRPMSQTITINRPAKVKKGVPNPGFMRSLLQLFPKSTQKMLLAFTDKYLMEPADKFDCDIPGMPLIALWDSVLPASTGMRVLPHGDVPDVSDKARKRHAFTTLCALDRIWMFKPSKVRILCADMSGTWIEGKTEEDCMQIEYKRVADGQSPVALNRWAHERFNLESSIEFAKSKFAVEVEFVTPEPLP